MARGLACGLEDLVDVSQSPCFKACIKLEGHGQGNIFSKIKKNKFDSNNDASNECEYERTFLNLLEFARIYLNWLEFT